MILGDPALAALTASGGGRVTIDEAFRRLAQRRPDAPAVADAPNRGSFAGGAPRRLTYAEADRVVSAIAGRLRRMGLLTDSIVGIQLPNTVENVLTILGALRAGLIVAPLPLLWRRADAVAALARVGAKALITCGRVGTFDHAQFAMRVAAEVFSIRYVCGFGPGLPDGVVSFDDLFTAEKLDPVPPFERERGGNAAEHVAAITFDVGPSGLVPVARNHPQLLAGGLGVLLESGMAQGAVVLSTVVPSSFAGIALTLLSWIIGGGRLLLHHPFEPDVLAGQLRDERCDALVVPGPVAAQLADAGILSQARPASLIAAWRSPDQLAASTAWEQRAPVLTDVSTFGEVGLVPARRGADGLPSPMRLGLLLAPRTGPGGAAFGELTRTEAGTLAMRGSMVPRHSFPPSAEQSGRPYLKIGPGGLVDTGYACRFDSLSKTLIVTGTPPGVVNVGGYRFLLRDLQDVCRRIDGGATLAVLPDPLIGQRLVGNSVHREAMQAALESVGVNPLVIAAFNDRSERPARWPRQVQAAAWR